MIMGFKKRGIFLILVPLFFSYGMALGKEIKKKHPFDFYDHDMHMTFFEAANVACETCHADPDSFTERSKVNAMGCHLCHNSAKPIIAATNKCTICHEGGAPKPITHLPDWKTKHQTFAKTDPESCQKCHTNANFCIKCHARRDTVQEVMHRRNFRYFHSI